MATIALADVIQHVQRHVQILVKPKLRNIAQIVQAIVLQDVLPPVPILARLRHHKVVTIAVIHAKQAVEDSAIGLVVVLATSNVKVLV